MAKWSKNGDFATKIKVCYYYREIEYVDTENKGNFLRMYGFPEGDISIHYKRASDELFEKCMQIKGVTNLYVNEPKKNFGDVRIQTREDKGSIEEFINLIDEYNCLSEIKNEIFVLVFLCRV